MKKQYIQPTTDFVDIRMGITMQVNITGGSKGTDELGTNETVFDEDGEWEMPSQTSLWDD